MEEEVDNVGEGGRWPRVSKDWSGLSNSEEMSRPELLRLPMGEPCIPEEEHKAPAAQWGLGTGCSG